jgi:DinB family protein
MTASSLSRLEYLCANMPALLGLISEEEFALKPSADKWSKKEILGHLIDSATNNHHRFIRAQFVDRPRIDYHADSWVIANHYQELPIRHLIFFWQLYNLHLAKVIGYMPADILQRECDSGDPTLHTLEWLFDDYVDHLEHHLHQLVEYD